MKTKNLKKACDLYSEYLAALKAAHLDAINGNPFAEVLLLGMIEDSVKLETQLNQIKDAAGL